MDTLTASPGTGAPEAPDGLPIASARRHWPWARALGPMVFFGMFLAVWQWFASSLKPQRKFLVPSPGEVWREGFADSEVRGRIWDATFQTSKEAFWGLAIATMLGIGLAVLMSQARWIERSVFPWAVALQTVPILALVPFIKVRYGVDMTSRIIVCVLIAVFPIITNTLFGLQSADEGHHDLFTLHRAGRLKRLGKLLMPGALPAIFTGLRISAGLSVVGAIVGEFFFRTGDSGLGHLIETYRARTQSYPALFATIIVTCVLGIVVFVVFTAVANLSTRRWYEPATTSPE